MIGETPSPARAGRRSLSATGGSASTQVWPVGVAAGEVVEQVEGLGQDVVARHGLELGDVERRQHAPQILALLASAPSRGARSCASRVSKMTVPPPFMKPSRRRIAASFGSGRLAAIGQ